MTAPRTPPPPPTDILVSAIAAAVSAQILPQLQQTIRESSPTTAAIPVEERFLSAVEVAKITSLSRETIRQRAIMGQFPAPIHITPKRKAWPLSAVRAWMTEQTKNNANS